MKTMETRGEFVLKYYDQFYLKYYEPYGENYRGFSSDREIWFGATHIYKKSYSENIDLYKIHHSKDGWCGQNKCWYTDYPSGEECEEFYHIGIVLDKAATQMQRMFRRRLVLSKSATKIQSIVRMSQARKTIDILRCTPDNLFDSEFGPERRQKLIKEELWKS